MTQSVIEIREEILESLRETQSDFLWVTGEPLVDILDSVAEFHFNREVIVELTKNLNKVSGFTLLTYNSDYRQQISTLLNLSMTSRNQVFPGVPNDVDNDLDAFIWYYLDRFAERRGYRRRAGSNAFGQGTLTYQNTYGTGTFDIILTSGSKIYKMFCDTANATTLSGTQDQVEATIYAFSYGSSYNAVENSWQIESITWSGGAATLSDFTILHDLISEGTDYQSSESF